MTNPPTPDISRRRALASVGAIGVGAFGATLADRVTRAPREYSHYTYAATPEQLADEQGPLQLRVAWESRYNGEPVDAGGDEPTFVGDADGPLFSVPNVLPGDYGTASIRLAVEGDRSARVRLAPVVTGSLADAVRVTLGYDTGFFGIGACEGVDAPSDVADDVSGSLAAFGAEYGEEGLALGGCLEPGEELCLGFAWEFPASETNEWQHTSTAFELGFHAAECVR